MSALLVPSSSSPAHPRRNGDGDRNRDIVLGPITAQTYRAFLASPHGEALGAGFLQCPSWADVKEGWRAQLLGWGPDPEAGELAGVALVLLRQFPGTRKYFAYLPEGPVADWSDPDLDAWLTPLLEHLRRTGAFAVRIGPSPAHRRWSAARLKPLTGP
ncbi:peptidoglycan bridge formation glycyltransferase FemA/FemB family protein, partial [Streptomyces sp. SID2119]|uniref:peptidoglycan bridge formation glycyltransferase FemA/FemB family protein n=1 Tax=Streptomyces sp. SID2119 TaxID=2690253 RepID=UPI001369E2D2|nr:peptidoglycan bridge formation glycyltransferase FemA/FemB family protein [Streptomyces sp. SID2119]